MEAYLSAYLFFRSKCMFCHLDNMALKLKFLSEASELSLL